MIPEEFKEQMLDLISRIVPLLKKPTDKWDENALQAFAVAYPRDTLLEDLSAAGISLRKIEIHEGLSNFLLTAKARYFPFDGSEFSEKSAKYMGEHVTNIQLDFSFLPNFWIFVLIFKKDPSLYELGLATLQNMFQKILDKEDFGVYDAFPISDVFRAHPVLLERYFAEGEQRDAARGAVEASDFASFFNLFHEEQKGLIYDFSSSIGADRSDETMKKLARMICNGCFSPLDLSCFNKELVLWYFSRHSPDLERTFFEQFNSYTPSLDVRRA